MFALIMAKRPTSLRSSFKHIVSASTGVITQMAVVMQHSFVRSFKWSKQAFAHNFSTVYKLFVEQTIFFDFHIVRRISTRKHARKCRDDTHVSFDRPVNGHFLRKCITFDAGTRSFRRFFAWNDTICCPPLSNFFRQTAFSHNSLAKFVYFGFDGK